MNRRTFMKHIGLGAAALAVGANSKAAQSAKPNIILIMCDDMGYSDIGCYGGEIDTPNLDRLAEGGLRFKQFYNTARCCPSRASLLTGLYPHQAGIGKMVSETDQRGYEGYLTNRGVTIAEVLRPAGYRTHVVGKWHVTPMDNATNQPTHREALPLQRGFDTFWGTVAGAGSYYYPKGLMDGNTVIEAEDPDHFYYTDEISKHAAAHVREDAQGGKPFFMYVAYTSPHWPLHALPEDIAKYAERYKNGWDKLREERYGRMVKMGIIDPSWPLSPRARDSEPWEEAENKEWHARCMAVYAAQVDRMDQGIGTIIAALEETGTFDNTLILFLADNGGCNEEVSGKGGSPKVALERGLAKGWAMQAGNDPAVMPGPKETFQSYGPVWANASNTPFRRYKKWGHEGGISTPLIASWPARLKNAGGLTDEPGHIIDLMPTCAEAAGARYPEEFNGHPILPVEGISLLPILTTGTREGHEYIGWEHFGNRAIRRGKWKLVAEKDAPWELYDIEADRSELNNLANAQPDLAKELEAAWEAWAKRTYVK